MEITSEAVAFAVALVLSKTIDMLKKHRTKAEDAYDTLSATGKLAAGDIEIDKLPNKELAEEIKSAIHETYTNLGIVPRIIVRSSNRHLMVPDYIKVSTVNPDERLIYTISTPDDGRDHTEHFVDTVKLLSVIDEYDDGVNRRHQ